MYLKKIAFNHNYPTLDRFPFNLPIFQNTDSIEFTSPITFFVGENGSGKSTLLDAISRKTGLLPWGGSKTHRVHGNPYETKLASYLELTWAKKKKYGFYFRAEAFFNFAGSLDDILMDDPGRAKYFGGGSLNTISHGESFLTFFQGYSFQIPGLYLLDEPEAALSPKNQIRFLKLINQSIASQDRQYIIATHSPILLGCPGAEIFSFDDDTIRKVQLRETGAYSFYKSFFQDIDSFYSQLAD